jgi:hypothetical protein
MHAIFCGCHACSIRKILSHCFACCHDEAQSVLQLRVSHLQRGAPSLATGLRHSSRSYMRRIITGCVHVLFVTSWKAPCNNLQGEIQ